MTCDLEASGSAGTLDLHRGTRPQVSLCRVTQIKGHPTLRGQGVNSSLRVSEGFALVAGAAAGVGLTAPGPLPALMTQTHYWVAYFLSLQPLKTACNVEGTTKYSLHECWTNLMLLFSS